MTERDLIQRLTEALQERCKHEGPFLSEDGELKEQWLHGMLVDDRQRLVAVFDDRDRVVQMWRRNGVICFQVADGEF